MAKSVKQRPQAAEPELAIAEITVGGFKSIADEKNIEIRPLTILAGANSSGKSSMMQPLLLWKQTLESNYDPGPLFLNGPNVKFTSLDQVFSHIVKASNRLLFGVNIGVDYSVSVHYKR